MQSIDQISFFVPKMHHFSAFYILVALAAFFFFSITGQLHDRLGLKKHLSFGEYRKFYVNCYFGMAIENMSYDCFNKDIVRHFHLISSFKTHSPQFGGNRQPEIRIVYTYHGRQKDSTACCDNSASFCPSSLNYDRIKKIIL